MYAEAILLQYLRSALPDATVLTQWTAKAFSGQPVLVVQAAAGAFGTGSSNTGISRYTVQIDTYTGVDRRVCSTLAQAAVDALYRAWRNADYTADGWLSSLDTSAGPPTEQRLDGQPSNIHRYVCRYPMVFRTISEIRI